MLREELEALRADVAQIETLRNDMEQMMDVLKGPLSHFQPQRQDELQTLAETVLSHEPKPQLYQHISFLNLQCVLLVRCS